MKVLAETETLLRKGDALPFASQCHAIILGNENWSGGILYTNDRF